MSIQAAMNQLLGSAGSLAYQITAPGRFVKAQEQAEIDRQKKAWDNLTKAEQAAVMETKSAEEVVKGLDDKEIYDEEELQFFEDLTQAREKHAKIKEAMFDFDPTSDTLSAMQEYQYEARNSRDWLNRQRQKAQDEARILGDLEEFMTTEAGKRQAEYQLALSKEEAAKEGYDTLEALEFLRSQGAFKSNTQYKKAAYRLKQGGKI